MDLSIKGLASAAISSIRMAALGKKVNFVISGVQKSGTSALDVYLREHPDICMAVTKEVHFFDNDIFFTGIPNYLAYHSFFSSYTGEKMIGESTPIYCYWDGSIERMWNYNKDMKLILVLRNPITRAYSHWNMMRQRGLESCSFLDAVEMERDRAYDALPKQSRKFSYVDRGRYTEQIRRIKRYFPDKNLLILKQEELRERPAEALSLVWEFLGVDAKYLSIQERSVHSRAYERSMDSREFNIMLDIFEGEILHLERLLGWDCSDWLVQNL